MSTAPPTESQEPIEAGEKTPAPAPPRVIKIKRFQIGLNVLIQLAIVLGLVLMVNYLAFNHFKRWDFSRSQKYLLSEQTKQLLLNLKKPVKAVIFFNPTMEITPDVMSLLREYEYASKKKLTTEIVDPYKNFSRARELQAQYKFGANENVLILDYDGRNKFVNAQDMAEVDNSGAMFGQPPQIKAFKGEQAITSALLELTEGKQSKLYLLAGHGEPDLAGAAPAAPPPQGQTPESIEALKTYIGRQNIKAESLNLANIDKVPDDARAILILGPKYDLSEREINMLRQYWEKNGRLFVALDPSRATPHLHAFLAANGVRPQDDRILRVVNLGAIQGVVRDATGVVKSGSAATKRLEGITLQFLGQTQSLAIDTNAASSVQAAATPLIEAGEDFWGETDHRGERIFFDPNKDHAAPLAIAVGVEKGAVSGVNVDTARMIVVGNAEFLKDEALTEAGLDFALGGLNWMLNREELVGVAPKERKTFTLQLSEKQIGNIALTVMGLIPGLVALLGFAQWWQRRN
ncbi:MAG TPA: GldG family protein [Chthoniobacteraceae bacterium]|nr:GldG family protein [Chthoniobacteraceae bacterium]